MVRNSRLFGNGRCGVGIVAGDDFYFDSRLFYLSENLLNTLFRRVIEYRKTQELKPKVLLLFGEVIACKAAFTYSYRPVSLLPEILNVLAKLFFLGFREALCLQRGFRSSF